MSKDILIVPNSGYLAFTSSAGVAIEMQVTESNGVAQLFFSGASGPFFLVEDTHGSGGPVRTPVVSIFSDNRVDIDGSLNVGGGSTTISGLDGTDVLQVTGSVGVLGGLSVADDGGGGDVLQVTGSIGIIGDLQSSTFTGSLTEVSEGVPYIASDNMWVSTGSNGSLVIEHPITFKSGSQTPEGVTSGDVSDIYFDNFNSRYYMKITGNGTNTGWGMFGPERVILRSEANIGTIDAGNEVWLPWQGTSESTTLLPRHIFVMPSDGTIERITIVADQALNSSCDVEVHRAVDGSSTFSQIDTDLSMDLSTAYTAAQSNSLGVSVNAFDRIAVNFQSSTIPATVNIWVMLEIILYVG